MGSTLKIYYKNVISNDNFVHFYPIKFYFSNFCNIISRKKPLISGFSTTRVCEWHNGVPKKEYKVLKTKFKNKIEKV